MTKPVLRKRHQNSQTPIRATLREDSFLQTNVRAGFGALKPAHRRYFEITARAAFADSLDIDEGLKKGREQENRWDYLLGYNTTKILIAVEPHTADNSEITTIIKKRRAAIMQLEGHIRSGARVYKWIWVASGRVRLLPFEKAKLLLDQNGIEFIGGEIGLRHLC
jgi:hypothetical protein